MRSAFHDLARNRDGRHGRIKALVALSAFGVKARAARVIDLAVLLIPIGGPLPHVAGHIVETITVGRKTAYRRRALETIFFKVLPGKFTLPGVGHMFST